MQNKLVGIISKSSESRGDQEVKAVLPWLKKKSELLSTCEEGELFLYSICRESDQTSKKERKENQCGICISELQYVSHEMLKWFGYAFVLAEKEEWITQYLRGRWVFFTICVGNQNKQVKKNEKKANAAFVYQNCNTFLMKC